MRALAPLTLLAACAAAAPEGVAVPVTYLGRLYEVRAVAAEPAPPAGAFRPTPDGGLAAPPDAPLGAPAPAVRVRGAVSRETASDVLATFCGARGLDVAPGWRGAPVRFDDATGEHVFYLAC